LQSGEISVLSKVGGGKREVVESGLPAVLGLETDINEPQYAGLPAVISALRAQMKNYDLQALGLTGESVVSTMECVGYSIPRPRPKKVFMPDTNLSAAERLNQLMSGGVAQRSEDIFEGSPEELSEKFVAYLDQVNVLSPRE
jgi:electron transfer flavoprotein beta subunit